MKTSGDPEFHGEQLTMMGMDLMSAGSDVRDQKPFPDNPDSKHFPDNLLPFLPDYFYHPVVDCLVSCPEP